MDLKASPTSNGQQVENHVSAPIDDTYLGSKARIRVSDFQEAKRRGEKWAMLTSYDTVSAKIFDLAKIPCLLIGDSAAQNVFGLESTIPVTLDELIPLARAVSSSCTRALVIGDLPFGSYQESPELALRTAVRFMKEAQVHAIKLEGGAEIAKHVKLMTQSGVPVMGHIGFTPQSEHALGGYKIQGRGETASKKMLDDALALQEAGAFAVLIELVPSEIGETITKALRIPVISIGAGPNCDAQVLVWNDMAGFSPPVKNQSGFKLSRTPKFVKKYASLSENLYKAALTFASEVRSGAYPAEEHCYGLK